MASGAPLGQSAVANLVGSGSAFRVRARPLIG